MAKENNEFCKSNDNLPKDNDQLNNVSAHHQENNNRHFKEISSSNDVKASGDSSLDWYGECPGNFAI